jgi:hypothetical protein
MNYDLKIDAQMIAVLISGFISIILIFTNIIQFMKNLKYKSLEKEIISLESQLRHFYYPFQLYRMKCDKLYSILLKDKPKGFRTLEYISNKKDIDRNDQIIIEEILLINKEVGELILNKGYYVEDKNLQKQLFPSIQVHISVLELVYKQKLDKKYSDIQKFVFPVKIDQIISEDIDRIREEIKLMKK